MHERHPYRTPDKRKGMHCVSSSLLFGSNRGFTLCVRTGRGSLFLEQMDKLESQFANGTLPELIFIGIKPADRLDEYTPWPAPS